MWPTSGGSSSVSQVQDGAHCSWSVSRVGVTERPPGDSTEKEDGGGLKTETNKATAIQGFLSLTLEEKSFIQ